MLAGIRTRDLRKIYTSPPPLASGGSFGAGRGKGKKQPKAESVAACASVFSQGIIRFELSLSFPV
jgi:hypothetical protein